MLKSMSVKNFAIIDNIQIDYKNNMSVLTGETGAGKSLIIDAIGLLFGDRASSELVRHGENKATIEGIFENQEDTNLFLNDNDIDIEDYLVIKREIYENGKSICKINGEAVSLNLLSELGVMLGNIHTQFDNEKLTDPKNYFDFIDTSEVKDLLIKYQIILKEYNQKNKEYNKLLLEEEENKQKLDYLKYQYAELKKANLSINEEEDLKNQAQILNNYEKISSNVEEFLSKENALDEIYDSISSLENVAKYDDDFASLKESLMEAYYNINDIFEEVKNKYSKNDIDLNELNNINDRLSVYSDLKRKYKKTTEEIIEFYESLKDKIDSIENFDVLSKDLKKEVDKLHSEVLSLALRISELRKTSSKQIEKEIITNLNDLQLNNTILEIKIESNENNFKRNGIDEVLIDNLPDETKEEVLKALNNYVQTKKDEIGTVNNADLVKLGLSGSEVAKINREKVNKMYNLGFCNAKTFLKRVNYSKLTVEDLKKAL